MYLTPPVADDNLAKDCHRHFCCHSDNYCSRYRGKKDNTDNKRMSTDYKDRIYSARHDKSISKSERKATVRQLKSHREMAIRDAERNYYKSYDNKSR